MRAGARGQDSGFRGWDSGIRQGWLVGGKSQDGWLYGCLVLNFALTITAGVPVDDLRAQTTLPRPGLVLSVRVYNYAHASRGMLSYAENEAGRIIGATGVAVAWLDCLAPQGVLRLRPSKGDRTALDRLAERRLSCGFCLVPLPRAQSFATLCSVTPTALPWPVSSTAVLKTSLATSTGTRRRFR